MPHTHFEVFPEQKQLTLKNKYSPNEQSAPVVLNFVQSPRKAI